MTHLFKVGEEQLRVQTQIVGRPERSLIERLELEHCLHPELLADSFAFVGRELGGVANLERIRRQHGHLVDGVVDAVRFDELVFVTFTLLQFHSFHTDEGRLVAVFKLVLLVSKEFDDALLGIGDGSDDDVLKLLTVLVEDLEAVAEVVKDSTKDSFELGEHELLSFSAAVGVDCDDCWVVGLCEHNHVHVLKVPGFLLQLLSSVGDGKVRSDFAPNVVVQLLETWHALLGPSLAFNDFINEELSAQVSLRDWLCVVHGETFAA